MSPFRTRCAIALVGAGTLLGGLGGCTDRTYPAPYDATVEVPEDFALYPSEYYYDWDAEGTLLFARSVVYHPTYETPLANIEVEIISGGSGVYIIPDEAIMLADMPSTAEGVSSYEEAEAACDQDGNGQIDDTAGDWCSWYWDSESGSYYQLSGEYADTEDFYRPNYLLTGTNNYGVVEFYLFVDRMPHDSSGDEIEWYSVDVYVNITADTGYFTIKVDS